MRFGEVTNLWARRGTGSAAGLLRRPHRRGADRPARAVALRSVRADVRDGKLYGRGAADMKSSIAAFVVAIEALRRASSPTIAGSIASAHLRRGRPRGRRHRAGGRGLKARGETHRLLHRRRADLGRRARRHDQERPPRLALRRADGAGRAGPRRLSAAARTRSTCSRPALAELAATRVGRGQRVLPADHLAGLEHPRRHRRAAT